MSFEKEIKNEIESILQTQWVGQNKTPIQFENVKFTPPTHSRYLQMYIIPISTQPGVIGSWEVNYEYLLQLNLVSPADTGTNKSLELIDELIEIFQFTNFQTSNNCYVDFWKPAERLPSYTDNNGKFIFPIQFQFKYRLCK